MARNKVLGLAVVCLALVASATTASAQSPYLGGCGPWLGYDAFQGWSFWENQSQRLPHYALYPPVYYSYPVPRTYGYSPFAYPSYVMTPDAPPAAPLTITNPYVPKSPAKPGEKQTPAPPPVKKASTAGSPLRVQNPYLQRENGNAGAQAAAITGTDPAPERVFPTVASRKS